MSKLNVSQMTVEEVTLHCQKRIAFLDGYYAAIDAVRAAMPDSNAVADATFRASLEAKAVLDKNLPRGY